MFNYGTDRELLQQAVTWLQAGHRVALVTVAKTWGSSPRPAGSMLVMRDDGVHAGSVSGGCVEEDLVERYRAQQLAARYPTLINYGVDRQTASRFGLPCGGRLELVVEQLESAVPLLLLLEKLQDDEIFSRHVCLNTGEVSLHPAHIEDEFHYSSDTMIQVFGPTWHMLLIGAGHLSQYVAQLALLLNYRVAVCDPREEYEQGWSLDGIEFIRAMPDDAVAQIAHQPRSIVLCLTHDPKLDDMALWQALTSDIFYIGALGSQRNSQARRERLLQLGITAKQLERLHAPVGLPIGSHTPPEIAIAILAEITAERHQVIRTVHDSLLYA
jgi:xanthine dehydrogenase accessory factor